MKLNSVLTIDPAIGSLGWALWKRRAWENTKPVPSFTGLLEQKGSENWWERSFFQASALEKSLKNFGMSEVYCEMPEFFGTAGGFAAAQTDSLQKLCYLVGQLGFIFRDKGADFYPIKVTEWKGQLSKEVVMMRVIQILGSENCRNFKKDIWDAVGIGLYIKGLL